MTIDYLKDIEKAIEIRALESELLGLFSKGLLNGTVHTCVGQEIIGVIVSKYLEQDDFVVSNHRGHGHYIARTNDTRGLLAEVMGRTSGCSGGVGGSQHLVNSNYLSNGIQGGMAPIAAGISLANKLSEISSISVVYLGDGTLGEGILYETLNICALWNIPIVFVLEDNGYAQSTSKKQTFAGSLRHRVEGFGVKYFNADSNDIDQLDSQTKLAIDAARHDDCPVMLHVNTYRLNSHSKGDDNRSEIEIKKESEKDLLNRFKETYPDLYSATYSAAINKITQFIKEIMNEPKLESCESMADIPYFIDSESSWAPIDCERVSVRYNEEIHIAISSCFEAHKSVLIGEDVEYKTPYTDVPYGGAFKVSRDLSERYPEAVKNTPISEAAIVGIGTGLAIKGIKSFVEIMFGDFTTLITDQLQQHAAKFKKMYSDKVTSPVIVRTPMGGKRGYGPTHSQSIESMFYSILGLRIVALNQLIAPQQTIGSLVEMSQEPTLLIENKSLYTQKRITSQIIPGYSIQTSNEVFSTVKITPNNIAPQVTILCYGGTVEDVLPAVQQLVQNDIFVEVLIPTSLKPMNIHSIKQSVCTSKKLLIVEEGNCHGGILSSVVVKLLQDGVVFSLKSLSSQTILSCALDAELDSLPNSSDITMACKELAKI